MAAYLLAQMGGDASPAAKDIIAILSSVGIETDVAQLKKVMAELEGKDVAELIKAGSTKLSSMPSSGGSAAPAASSSAAPAKVHCEQ